MDEKYLKDYKALEAKLLEQGEYDLKKIERAFEICTEAHKGQYRFSHEEYYVHPLAVAEILIKMGMDSESIIAALLHDVIEDTAVTHEDVEKEFGSSVANLVEGVTKLGKIQFTSKEEFQAENLRKMFMAMNEDIRVIIIKLADRLHNMRTLDAMREDKQREKSLETLEIYAPIAHRLGIRAVKEELEDLAILHLDPIAYHEVEQSLSVRKPEREENLKKIRERIEHHLREVLPSTNVQIESRVKSIHGIYRKMYIQGRDFDEIYDIYAVRIITDSIGDCYNILGIMHDMFRPIPNRFKDYISTPKPNMYQSLHTTVIGREGIPFEIQIRTFDMHHTAEYGIAAHWKYKEGLGPQSSKMDERISWVRQILESQNEDENANDIIQTIKTDLSQEDVFAVTPKGDVINLPVGSTIIDFAFAIHSAVGIKMVGAKVDGRIVPLNHVIKTGEIIEIITTNAQNHAPSRDWLKIAVTNQAKAKIRGWFKKERRTENIETGKSELEREFSRNGINLPPDEMEEFLSELARRQHLSSIEDFYAAIGYGGIVLSKIMPRIKDDYSKLVKSQKPVKVEDIVKPVAKKTSGGVEVEGIDNCLIKLSKCCSPLPGDDIIGFITRGHGVSVHKRDCCNVPRDIKSSEEPERWVNARWNVVASEDFVTTLQITGVNRDGMLMDVTSALFNMKVTVHAVNARSTKNGNCVVVVTLKTASVEHLHSITARLGKLHGVFSVERINQ
ncbi:MAG: bifunctional (p)ppGpp synthetase/guanosine-3',5'-bis(diphosphate) 3'-pyrophosphohydrolase [Clostridia bacterium]|nr:bifunctional (p)ppGpp synthetase/guanosine-3',5'-bis(diphosphate) 3'-pyrophosphohydrolase [Clostridia bacterium]